MVLRSVLVLWWASLSPVAAATPPSEALTVTGVDTGSVTLAWDANTEPDLTGYTVQVAKKASGPYSDRLTTTETHATVDALDPGTTYYFVVRAINALELTSTPSNEVSATTPGLPLDDCAPVTGRYAVSIFLTSLLKTGSGGPGSRARVLFQLASPNAPITSVGVYADSVLVSRLTKGDDLTDDPGSWFTMPASGSYVLSVTAANNHGCTKTATYGPPLNVP